MTQIPLTANGKVDRKALPLPDDTAFSRRTYEAPQGETERALAEIWQSLLKIERVGRYDSFFELGGHSLLAVQMISRVRAAMDREISLAMLFAQPSLRDVAQRLSEISDQTSHDQNHHVQTTQLPAITPLATGGTPPLSLAQQRIWFVSEMDDAATEAYTITGGVHLQGTLNVLALQRALDRIMVRHASLRTRIETHQGVPNQVVRAAHGNSFPLIITAMSDAPFKPRFDLAKGPLVQGTISSD
ncbi:phosphopantetheine-binding protein [Vibrio sp. PP-XX7]